MSLDLLCIDDDREFLLHLQLQLERHHRVVESSDIIGGMRMLEKQNMDAVLLDIGLDGMDGISGLRLIKKKYPLLPVIMVTARRDAKVIVSCMREGAFNYICKPFEAEELIALLDTIEEARILKEHNQALIATLNNNYMDIPMVGRSAAFKRVIEQATMLKGHDANVLIEGESGTGKELLALYVHNLEGDPKRPHIAINCAAMPKNLIESELFGHERGAFTGAVSRKIGKFEIANGGDIFLDEVSSLPLDLQTKLLRALQEKTFCRIGGNDQIHSEFRVIAATNVDLDRMVEDKGFRLDLYHRLRVVHLCIPPLRERREDISELVKIFLEKRSMGSRAKSLSDDAVSILMEYDWPGNIRELENLVHSLIIMNPSDEIGIDGLPLWLTKAPHVKRLPPEGGGHIDMNELGGLPLKEFMRLAEQSYIKHTLMRHGDDKQRSAEALGLARSTFYSKLKQS